jgi:2-polyprenyl-3-methyl-5-hydroxy-6-metoxy-1,4-benzoquinol methylase
MKVKKAVKERLKERKSGLVDHFILRYAPPYWQVAASFPPASRILDIGCGAGWKLDLFKEFGWETYGFDISAEATEVARKKGHNVQAGRFEDINYPDNFFIAVQISHVIEHLPDAKIVIKRVHELLMNGGILLVETPNISGLIAKLFGADYWQIDSPRHFQLFTKKTISNLINMSDFKIDRVLTLNSKNGILNSVQSFFTRKYGKEINVRNNLLLKLVNRSLFYLLSPACKLGSGENIVVFAEKKNE